MPLQKQQPSSSQRTWTRLHKDKLLDMRICDLHLQIDGSPVAAHIAQLYRELGKHFEYFRPHFWLSDEWYCPDGIPGVAIPFFLAHTRLKQLELENMLEVEGGDRQWCLKLLRHETGHALLNAYKLDQRKDWRKVFGSPKAAYPDTYLPKPYSKRFVINLPGWYAQSHPHEDWAETFAVWLNPRSEWKKRYQNWGALKKLRYVEELMQELHDRKPLLRNRHREYPVEKIRLTLREYYQDKRARYGMDSPEFFDIDLTKLFVSKEQNPDGQRAASYIRSIRRETIEIVERWTGEYRYRINEVLKDMIKRCDELKLYTRNSGENLLPEVTACLTMLVMNKLHSGGFHVSR